jgi:hypothetical protein
VQTILTAIGLAQSRSRVNGNFEIISVSLLAEVLQAQVGIFQLCIGIPQVIAPAFASQCTQYSTVDEAFAEVQVKAHPQVVKVGL